MRDKNTARRGSCDELYSMGSDRQLMDSTPEYFPANRSCRMYGVKETNRQNDWFSIRLLSSLGTVIKSPIGAPGI